MPLFDGSRIKRLRDRIAGHRRDAKPIAKKLAPAPIEEFERDLAPPPRRPLRDFATGLVVKAVLNRLKGTPEMEMLRGKKTYLTAAAIVLIALGEAAGLIDVPGFDLDIADAIMLAIMGVFGRVGAKTEAKKVAGN